MLVAHRNGMAVWTNPYVTDGLVAMWDGEWNAGGGVHDPNATTWKDLVGRRDLAFVSGAQTISGKSIVFNNTSLGCKLESGIDDVVSIEFCGMVATNREASIFCARDNPPQSPAQKIFTVWFYNNAIGSGRYKNGYLVGINNPVTIYFDYTNGDVVDFSAKALNGIVESPTGASDYFSSIDSLGFGFRNSFPFNGEVCSFRIYSRNLTAAEIAANYAIDKRRFNLP